MFLILRSGLLWCMVCLAVRTAVAQEDCPCFTVRGDSIGCAPFLVHVDSCTTGRQLNYNYGDGPGATEAVSHLYELPGRYAISQFGNFTCGGILRRDTLTRDIIVVKPIPAPKLTTYPCAGARALVVASDPQYDEYWVEGTTVIPVGGSQIFQYDDTLDKAVQVKGNYLVGKCGGTGTLLIKKYTTLHAPRIAELRVVNGMQAILKWESIPYQRYEILQKDATGGFKSLDTLSGTTGQETFTIQSLNTINTTYCFKIRAFDYCGNSEESPELCTVVLSGEARDRANVLEWNQDGLLSTDAYGLTVNGSEAAGFSGRPVGLRFHDSSIVCGGRYCYQIKGTFAQNIPSYSNEVCLDAVSKAIPPALSEVLATVAGQAIVLEWPAAQAIPERYNVMASSNRTAYSPLAQVATTSYTDNAHNAQSASFCYKVSYTDRCGNTSRETGPTCSVWLTGETKDPTLRTLRWSAFQGWPEGVKEYVVEKLNASGMVYFSQNIGPGLEFADRGLDTLEQILRYRIRAVSMTDRTTFSNVWETKQVGAFFVPTAFSPNDDGLNDTFHAEGLFIKEFKMEIWNRHGEGVFATTSFREGWDGKINGRSAPVDTYMYRIEARDVLGTTYKRSGSLQLVK